MQELNAKLLARAQSVEHKHNLMMEQMTQINECLKQKTAENERLQSELNMLKNSIKVSPVFSLMPLADVTLFCNGVVVQWCQSLQGCRHVKSRSVGWKSAFHVSAS